MNTEGKGFTLWLAGPRGAGAGTLAAEIGQLLLERGCRAEVLDDAVRTRLAGKAAASAEDDDANDLRIGFACDLLARNGVVAVAAARSPSKSVIDELRAAAGEPFILVHLDRPAEAPGSPGSADPYEAPDDAEVVIRTDRESLKESCARIMLALEQLELVPRVEDGDYSKEEEAAVRQRLKDLGYF